MEKVTTNDRLSSQSEKTPSQVFVRGQVDLSDLFKKGINLNKMERRAFVIDFGRNFGRYFVICVKNLLP